jgi:hypothetical protein
VNTDPAMTASVYLGRDFLGDKTTVAEHTGNKQVI